MIRNRRELRDQLEEQFGDDSNSVEHGHADHAPDQVLRQWVGHDKALVIIGDSHSYPYYQLDRFPSYEGPLEAWIFCPGATARGLPNEDSSLGYGLRIKNFVSRLRTLTEKLPPMIFKFGQVDIEFTFQHQRIRTAAREYHENDFRTFCKISVGRYKDYLDRLFSQDERQWISISAVNPPCLSDRTWATGYVQANWQIDHDMTQEEEDTLTQSVKRLEIPDLRTRTFMHRIFNATLADALEGSGFRFLDDFDIYLDTASGVVQDGFVGPMSGADWHLDRDLVAPVVMENIRFATSMR